MPTRRSVLSALAAALAGALARVRAAAPYRVALEYEGDLDDMPARLEGMRTSLRVMETLVAGAAGRSAG